MTSDSSLTSNRRGLILIVDDHALMRRGLRELIRPDETLSLCGEADSVETALEQLDSVRPDLVVVDLMLIDGNGLDLVETIRRRDPTISSLVWSMHDENLYAERALRAGAVGFVSKAASANELLDAIRDALNGRGSVSQATAQRLLDRSLQDRSSRSDNGPGGESRSATKADSGAACSTAGGTLPNVGRPHARKTTRRDRPMTDDAVIEKTAKTTARGVARDTAEQIRQRVEPPADQLKDETADRVEGIAHQVRQLGLELDRPEEAHAIARRLERTADYLRYRPATRVATDAWDAVTQPKVLWAAGGALAALVIYRALKRRG